MSYISFYIFAFLFNFTVAFAKFDPSTIFASSKYAPSARFGHSAVLTDTKLYFHGGFNGNENSNDFFYLDVCQDFSITDIPWDNLPFPGTPRNHQASACIGGENDDLIFMFGGNVTGNPHFTSKFDITNEKCTNLTSSGRKKNDLWIFDSYKLTWDISIAPNAPQDILGYSAITLPGGTILYLGGKYTSNGGLAPMGVGASGPAPPSRYYFSAVLTSDRRIIMFGGIGEDGSNLGDLWILDSETYEWSAENITNPNGLTINSHTATL
ncbi:hypothetical protein C2G38_2151486 [Gigaspora rosea]|uniref:Galactose oxidase n=1 Tax=Gigaspora rosea TaxID=44941 RepID=A0A397W9H1_9GLOM|nr:hypothetical protein C2G38_2151486 [Gigaspora rosea]